MSDKFDDLLFGVCLAKLVDRMSKKGQLQVIPTPAPMESEDALQFCFRVAEAEFSAIPSDRLFLRSTFEEVHSAVEAAAAYWFGGDKQYLRKNPKDRKLKDAKALTVSQLMEKYGISRSYAFQLKKESKGIT